MPIETKEARMTATPTAPARDPLAGDPAEALIRGMVATIVREAHPLAVILFGSRAWRPPPPERRRPARRPA